MLEKVLALKSNNNSVMEFDKTLRQGIPLAAFGVSESFKSFMISALNCPVVLVVKDYLSACFYRDEIKRISNKTVAFIPAKEESLLMVKAFSKDIEFDRIKGICDICADVVIITAEALLQTYPKKTEKLEFIRGKDYDFSSLSGVLTELGYVRSESVEAQGTFSLRGDVLDIYTVNGVSARLDFFGDTVESIKKIDLETKKNLGAMDFLTVYQATENLFNESDIEKIKTEVNKEVRLKRIARLTEKADDILESIEKKDFDALKNLSVLSENTGYFFDIIPDSYAFIFDEPKRLFDIMTLSYSEFESRFNSLEKGGEVFSFMKGNTVMPSEIVGALHGKMVGSIGALSTVIPFFNPLKIINVEVSATPDYKMKFEEVYNDISNWLFSGYRVLVCAGDLDRAERFSFDLSGKGIASSLFGEELKGVCISSEKLKKGFVYHEEKVAVIGTNNLYSSPKEQVKRKSNKVIFSAPTAGDYCVHETYGIGKVLGNKKITTLEGTKDYVAVEYFGGDVLYIPVEQMDILTKYLGAEKTPRLSKIGGKDFERIKNSARESIKKMSFNLKKLYSERSALKGYKFTVYEDLESEFISAFPFEETPDQIQADSDIKADMTSGKVMDRLVCGDVGFGKTEVAFRAVFRTIANGKQSALLCPTTILCEQHYNNAMERFKDFGIRIACLNRFRSQKEQEKIIEKIKSGEVDFVIGTHRLLSRDVEFKDLGLLVLDEEQRFGVEHKEKIKLLKKDVNTLTLTATPIPRTLHMSLTGIRSISTINTPPKQRLPVQTYVTEETDALIRDAVLREVNRGGQVFLLYNRAETIYKFADRVKELLPNINLVVVHGRMEEKEMERGIMRFYSGECNVLVSTTIIENGIDLPRANTLIVIDADYLGLSTLYQLKGRVGRSDRLAYAYFTFKREKILSDTAYERLNAITDFAEMGSGIKIAMRDLEIRGAGNILGAEQHGHMDKIGYELYSKLLKEELTGIEEQTPELDIRVNAFIPDKYIENSSSRMDAYKQIAEINSEESEKDFIGFATDTFGTIPKEVYNLIDIAVCKWLGSKIKVSNISVKKGDISLTFNSVKNFSNEKIIAGIEDEKSHVSLSMEDKPKIKFTDEYATLSDALSDIRRFLVRCTQ